MVKNNTFLNMSRKFKFSTLMSNFRLMFLEII